MYRLALLSVHGCPIVRLGEKDTGGMNVYVLQLARELARRGNLVDVFTRYHDPDDPQIVELEQGARVIHLNAGPHGNGKESLYGHIAEFVGNLCNFQISHRVRYDLIHSHYWLSGRVGMALSTKWGVPHVTTFHTLAKTKLMARSGEREPELRVATEERVAKSVDMVVVSTQQEKDELVDQYGAHSYKIPVVPAGVDLDLFRPVDKTLARQRLGLDGGKMILYVGRIEPIKGLDVLINAVSLLENGDDTKLIIVGGKLGQDQGIDHLRSLAEELGIEGKVVFTGSVEQRELPDYYSAADVFVLPSYSESFGLVVLEAMACATPVVVSRVGGLNALVKNGITGYLIPWHCPEPFAQRLDMLLPNQALREAMGSAARAKALQMSWGGVADRILDFYSCLIDRTWAGVAGE